MRAQTLMHAHSVGTQAHTHAQTRIWRFALLDSRSKKSLRSSCGAPADVGGPSRALGSSMMLSAHSPPVPSAAEQSTFAAAMPLADRTTEPQVSVDSTIIEMTSTYVALAAAPWAKQAPTTLEEL